MNRVDSWPDGYVDIVRRYADPSQPAREVDGDTTFADLGVNSMGFLGVLADLEDLAGLELDVEALTPEAFASPGGLWAWATSASSVPGPEAAGHPAVSPAAATADVWAPVLPSQQIVFGQGHGASVRSPADLILRVHQLDGALDLERLIAVLTRLRGRNDALRMVFRADGGAGYGRATAGGRLPISGEQLVDWREEDLPGYVRLLTRRVVRDWRDEEHGSARWMLLRLTATRHLLVTWYAHVGLDLRSVSDLERQVWAGYHENEETAAGPPDAFLSCLRRRQEVRDRCRPAHWDKESARVAVEPWDAATLSPTREHRRRLTAAELAGLRVADADDEQLSVAQVLAHRFAAGVRPVTAGPVVLHLFVDERTAAEEHVAGALSGLVPVVLDDADLVTPRAAARRMVRALASRPTRPGAPLPAGYVRLLTAARGYSFTYVPWRGNSVRPRYALEVDELPVDPGVRDPARGRLRVVELEHGGVELGLTVHPDEIGDQEADELLGRIAAAGVPQR